MCLQLVSYGTELRGFSKQYSPKTDLLAHVSVSSPERARTHKRKRDLGLGAPQANLGVTPASCLRTFWQFDSINRTFI